MDKIEAQLATLEWEMSHLCAMRADRVATAEALKRRANRDYDNAAIPLAREIKRLRAELEAEQQPEPKKIPAHVRSSNLSHDPEWSQEDIDHYYELAQRANKTRI